MGSHLVLVGVTKVGPEWAAGKTWWNSLSFLGCPGLSTSHMPVFQESRSLCQEKGLCILEL